MPTDREAHDERTARLKVMLEELRLKTEDLHELAKQATIRSWQAAQAARPTTDDVRAQAGARLTKRTREPMT